VSFVAVIVILLSVVMDAPACATTSSSFAPGNAGGALGSLSAAAGAPPDVVAAGLSPPLHLPVLAGLAQGPGFPNLSCLGLLSDRILRRYIPLEQPARRIVSERRELV